MAHDTSRNPYEAADVVGDERGALPGSWTIEGREVCCDDSVELPRICHITLQTENLLSFDSKLKCMPDFVGKIWLVFLVVVVAVRWLNLSVVMYLVIAFGTGLSLVGSLATKTVTVRLYETHATRHSRRKTRRLSMLINGSAIVLGLLAMLFVLETDVSPTFAAIVIFVLVSVPVFAPGMLLDWTTTSKLSVDTNKEGSFRIDGLTDAYLSALQKYQAESWEHGVAGR